jgi:hypothetical protein
MLFFPNEKIAYMSVLFSFLSYEIYCTHVILLGNMYCTAGPTFFGTYCTVSVNKGLLQYFYGHSLEIVDYLDFIFLFKKVAFPAKWPNIKVVIL